MTKSMACEFDFLTAKQVMLELLAERWLENQWGSPNAELGLQKCSFEASAWRTTNTELGLPTGPLGAGWAMYFLELLHFYLDETNAMRSTSVPEYLFLLSGRKIIRWGRTLVRDLIGPWLKQRRLCSVVTPNSLLSWRMLLASGIAVPDSQRAIACRDIFSFSAKSSCNIP